MYLDIHKYFDKYSKTERKNCLKLKKKIYGLRQIPHEFWKYLKNNLEACGLNKS